MDKLHKLVFFTYEVYEELELNFSLAIKRSVAFYQIMLLASPIWEIGEAVNPTFLVADVVSKVSSSLKWPAFQSET